MKFKDYLSIVGYFEVIVVSVIYGLFNFLVALAYAIKPEGAVGFLVMIEGLFFTFLSVYMIINSIKSIKKKINVMKADKKKLPDYIKKVLKWLMIVI